MPKISCYKESNLSEISSCVQKLYIFTVNCLSSCLKQGKHIAYGFTMSVSQQAWISGFKITTYFSWRPKDHTQSSKTTQTWTFMLVSHIHSWLLWIKMRALITTLLPVLGLLIHHGLELLELPFCTTLILRVLLQVLFLVFLIKIILLSL